MKNNTLSYSIKKIILLPILIILIPTVLLSSCSNENQVAITSDYPLPTSVEPTLDQIVGLNGRSVFKDVVVVSITPENEEKMFAYIKTL
jgi:uncharacterized lipoprotein YajG